MENKMEVPQKKKTKNQIQPVAPHPIPGYRARGDEDRISTRHLHAHADRSAGHNCQDMETTQTPIRGWMDTVRRSARTMELRTACCLSTGGPRGKSHRERQALYMLPRGAQRSQPIEGRAKRRSWETGCVCVWQHCWCLREQACL